VAAFKLPAEFLGRQPLRPTSQCNGKESPSACEPASNRDPIRERVTQVKRDQRQRNRYLGGIVPFGFRVGDDGSLVPDVVEQTLIAHARALRGDDATL